MIKDDLQQLFACLKGVIIYITIAFNKSTDSVDNKGQREQNTVSETMLISVTVQQTSPDHM